jgi:hypothetical protein
VVALVRPARRPAMQIDTSSIAYFAIGACVVGMLWALF